MARQKREFGQRAFEFKGWGGAREGAGRPRRAGALQRHAARAPVASRYPVHVTLRAVPGAPNLRRGAAWAAVEAALAAALARDTCRVVQFSVQTNHVHLIVEAAGAEALSRGVQGLAIRLARGVNRAVGRRGRLWGERYHARVLRTPREVRNALCYVLQNARRHSDRDAGMVDPSWIDPRSSGPGFDGWRGGAVGAPSTGAVVRRPRTWLLSAGWRRHGLIEVDEVPAAGLDGAG